MEKQKLAFEIENSSCSKCSFKIKKVAKLEEERRKHEIEVNQWKEALLELATFTLKSDVFHSLTSSIIRYRIR
jgi:D-Tyr-tRNAtyr deacylase